MSFGLEVDPFFKASKSIYATVDYFDFPSSLVAFAESLKSSHLYMKNQCFFRKRNKHLSLITFQCSSSELKATLDELKKQGYKIASLNYANKDLSEFKKIKYGDEFFVDSTWDFEKALEGVKSKIRSNKKRCFKNSDALFYQDPKEAPESETIQLFYEWYEAAQSRHFMVIKGHYLSYIHRYYKNKNNVHMVYFREKETNKLYGVGGYEIYNGQAQMTIMKHVIGFNSFPTWFWVKMIEEIIRTHQPSKIFCGTTADTLKRELCFSSQPSWKIKI